MFFVYVIENRRAGKIYIGQTANLEIRLLRHNCLLKNKSGSFTSNNPGSRGLVYKEEFRTRKEAIRREKQLKSFKGREFIKNQIKRPGH